MNSIKELLIGTSPCKLYFITVKI